jgi:inner membrane protein
MDTITHVLTGVVIAKAVDDEKIGGWGTVAGVAMGLFPDSDFVLGFINRQFSIEYHRAFTHSLLLIPVYALIFSWLFMKVSRRPYFWSFYKVCLPVLVSHTLLDLFTSYGTMILSPFWNHRYALDLLFIVDFTFSGLILIPLLISLFWRKKARWLCRGSLVGLTAYLLFCGVQHHRAIELAKTFAQSLNQEVVEVASLPQPASPFKWGNYIETKDRVYQGFVDLLMKGPPRPTNLQGETDTDGSGFFGRFRRWKRMEGLFHPASSVQYFSYQKNDGSPWIEKAMDTTGGKFYYWFARFPLAKEVASDNGAHRIEFTDVRFFIPGIRMPFSYYIELDDAGGVRSEGFLRDQRKR